MGSHSHSHTLFAMHNSGVSLFLCSVRRDGEQKAEQGDFIIPAVFTLRPTDFSASHPSSFPFYSLFLHHFSSPISCMHSPDLIWLQNPKPFLMFYFTICFLLFHQGPFDFLISSFSFRFFQCLLFFMPLLPSSSCLPFAFHKVRGEAKGAGLKYPTAFLSGRFLTKHNSLLPPSDLGRPYIVSHRSVARTHTEYVCKHATCILALLITHTARVNNGLDAHWEGVD